MIVALYSAVVLVLIWSGVRPYDRGTWLMEVAPVLIAFPVLWVTRHRFRLTTIVYILIALHALILIVGGAYTYARVPAGFWVQEWFGLSRNPYDKLGHLAQGFVPAMLARELFIRLGVVSGPRWRVVLICSVVLAISAMYELIEWWAALGLGQGAEEFLGTQGYVWDTQSDMFMALIGAIVALVTLPRLHDRQLAVCAGSGGPGGARD